MVDTVESTHEQLLVSILRDGMSFAQEKAAIEGCLRSNPTLATPLLFAVLNQKQRSRAQLEEAKKIHAEQLEAVTAPPWQMGVFTARGCCFTGTATRPSRRRRS